MTPAPVTSRTGGPVQSRGTGEPEVVDSQDQATALTRPPLLVLDNVRKFLDDAGLGTGALTWERIGDGQSNVTYRLQRDGADVVLRRGPRPPLPKSTHDMAREARIQLALAPLGVPVPRILAVCEDESVLGVPFYVMEHLHGTVLTDTVPPHLDSETARRVTSTALVDTLADLHSLDVSGGEIARLGRPQGYLERQVARFASLWDINTTRDLPAVGRLAVWLEENRPDTQRDSVIHGDYRAGNLMFAPDGPPRVTAVLDWEMATLGDPLADLGYLTATYADADEPFTPMELTPVTRLPGYLRRWDLIERYQERMSLDLSALPWYQALALWKAAIFSEAIHTRWLRGERPGDTGFGAAMEHGVPQLLDVAERLASRLK
jgi:aminoglycoside phosphotransferase (APT) family kinase protein